MGFSTQYCEEGGVQMEVRHKASLESAEFPGINLNPEVPLTMAGPHMYLVQRLRRRHV